MLESTAEGHLPKTSNSGSQAEDVTQPEAALSHNSEPESLSADSLSSEEVQARDLKLYNEKCPIFNIQQQSTFDEGEAL